MTGLLEWNVVMALMLMAAIAFIPIRPGTRFLPFVWWDRFMLCISDDGEDD